MAKQPQLSAADIAAQAQLQEEVEVQKAFETGITTLRDLISPSSIEIHSDLALNTAVQSMSTVIHARFIPVGSALLLILTKSSIFPCISIQSIPASS